MEREVAWKKYNDGELAACMDLCEQYRQFISDNKTERECAASAIKLAEANGYVSLQDAIKTKKPLKAGDKVWAHMKGKAVILAHIGTAPASEGFTILGAHIDSPRLDVKQNPLYESSDLVLMDTHYYGGIKYYQWVTMPLAIHGVVAKKDGSVVNISIGEDPTDPVFCVTDLLPHLGQKQMEKNAKDVVEGEALDILVGNRPLVEAAESAAADVKDCDGGAAISTSSESGSEPVKDPVKAFTIKLLADKYGIEEEDFLSAELEVVPAGPARDLGFDRSMIIGYGQDDRVCAYTSLVAQLELESPKKTAVCILVDKEEIGSVGATGMESRFFENTMAEVMDLMGQGGVLEVRRALAASRMLSSDVNAAVDPSYQEVFETKNASFSGRGLVFCKFTGARGKSGSNDCSAEYIGQIRRIMDDASVSYQFAELGKVNIGGGGTIAYIPAAHGMDVIDSGVAVLSMHAPWEVTSKADIYEAYKGYKAFQLAD